MQEETLVDTTKKIDAMGEIVSDIDVLLSATTISTANLERSPSRSFQNAIVDGTASLGVRRAVG